MIIEIVETFRKLSDGSLLHSGEILDIPQEKALRLVGKGRARLLPSGATGDAPSCPDEGSSEATLPRGDEAPFPARFKVGDRVRFTYRTALDVLEGVVVESKHHGPVIGWWYRIKSGGRQVWVSESHTAPGGSGSSNNEGGHP